MLANLPIISSLSLLLTSALAVQAVGTMSGNVEHWLRASEAELVAQAASTPSPVPAGTPHDVKRGSDGMFYLSATANDTPIRFLIDTGSNATILTRSDATRLGLDAAPGGACRARTLAGEVRITRATIRELRVAGKRFTDMEVGVASDDLGVSLIGQDVLSHFESIVFERDQASLR